MDFYRMLWSRLGGRPWTYIARDVYHRVEYLVLVSILVTGYAIGETGLVSWKLFMVFMTAYTIGYIHGHFFWGKEYVPNQTANRVKDENPES